MTPLTFIAAFVFYNLCVFLQKRYLFPHADEFLPPPLVPWEAGHEHAFIVSPDYWWAFRFKARMTGSVDPERRSGLLKRYVTQNNTANLIVSALLFVACSATYAQTEKSNLFALLSWVAVIRYVSRSYEITYAFGRDVIVPMPSTTGLSKHERIRLALVSYVEIFLYSAAAYLALPSVECPISALSLSLNVGTLTNVGLAFSGQNTSFVVNLVFIQVVTTHSLVVLSLAAYLARNDDVCRTTSSGEAHAPSGTRAAGPS